MKIRALLIVAASLALAGCGSVNIDHTSKPAASTSSSTKAQKAKASSKMAKLKEKARGKIQKYGLPTGPSEFYITANQKPTKYHLSEKTHTVAKLHEYDPVGYGADLPLLGAFQSPTKQLSDAVQEATMDESSSYQYDVILQGVGGYFETDDNIFLKFPNADTKALVSRAFGDLQQYWDAVNTTDASKLPAHIDDSPVTADMDGDITNDNKAEKLTTVQGQYFDKKGLMNNSDVTDPEVKVIKDNTDTPVVELFMPVMEKLAQKDNVKETNGVIKNDNYGKVTTTMSLDTLVYRLVDGQWKLDAVDQGDSSQYAQDTSGSNWIKEEAK